MSEKNEEKPVVKARITANAIKGYGQLVRNWSGIEDLRVEFSDTSAIDPVSYVDTDEGVVHLNPETTVLQPEVRLNVVTPYRLGQEPVVTGLLLHETGHLRHSWWMKDAKHTDGREPSPQVLSLAQAAEEGRVEYRVISDADRATRRLLWTMDAAISHSRPPAVIREDPSLAVIDTVSLALNRVLRFSLLKEGGAWPMKVMNHVEETLYNHISTQDYSGLAEFEDDRIIGLHPTERVSEVISLMEEMIETGDTKGSMILDMAEEILSHLFPQGDPPSAQSSCTGSDNQDPGDEKGEEGGGQPSQEAQRHVDAITSLLDQAAADAASQIEAAQDKPVPDEPKKEDDPMESEVGGLEGGKGGRAQGRWVPPTATDRELKRGAEAVLRSCIDPTETSRRVITDSPSSNVDPAALAAWRAGGGSKDPRFFVRTQRTVIPAPPVDIAVQVDVSSSMEIMQGPSAVLSWALADSALDLRNFAGSGQNVRSALIHWGDGARIIQKPGEQLPGVRRVSCKEGTSGYADACQATDAAIPGFFSLSDKPRNRLLINFTDWQLTGWDGPKAIEQLREGLAAGLTLVSVVPRGSYSVSQYRSVISGYEDQCVLHQIGRDEDSPSGSVWASIEAALKRR